MTKSREDLVNLALSLCYADGGSGQDADPEDFNSVNELVEPLFDELSELGIYTVGDPDEIENAAFRSLAWFLADASSDRFSKEIPPARLAKAENTLRQLNAETFSYQTAKNLYF